MAPSHYTLLLFVTVLSTNYVHSDMVIINTSWEFEKHMCNNAYNREKLFFVLNSSVVYNITRNSFCFMSTVDITIRSSINSPAIISCVHDGHIPAPMLGLAFINSFVTLQRVTFINCGTSLKTLPDNIINIFNSSSLHYSSTHAAALLFIQCRVHMSEVVLTRSYGFAVIGVNLVDSVLQNVHVSNSSASVTMYNYYNETIGCFINSTVTFQ